MKKAISDMVMAVSLLGAVAATGCTAFSLFVHQVVVPVAQGAVVAGGLPGTH